MLGSITPLGERGRGQSYAWAIGFFLVGSAAAGVGLGAILGAAGGAVANGGTAAAAFLVALVAVGLVLDLRVLRITLPSVRRQVDETWLTRYRWWVYGAGFGFQLGLGIITIVTTSAIYVALAAAFLSGSVLAGAAIGGTFGVVRWLSAAAGGFVRAPGDLACVAGLASRLERPARRLTLVAQLGVLAALLIVLAL